MNFREIIKYKNVTAQFINVDAETAKYYLEKNISNRRLDKNRVDKYVEDMKKGYWCFNGDAIRFDIDGNLIDGQHRLTAIVKTNIEQVFIVIKNVEKESKRTIDTGKARTGSDVLSMFSNVGSRDCGVIAGAITKLVLYEAGLGLRSGSTKHVTNSVTEEYYKKYYLEISKSIEYLNGIFDHHAMVLSRSEALFLHIIFSRVSNIEADIFLKKIITGIGIEENSNEKLLRNILTKRAMKTIKIPASDCLFTAIKAWNRSRKGGVYSSEGNLRYGQRDNGYPFAI